MCRGRELVRALKANSIADQPRLSIPVGSYGAVLRPVSTTPGALNENDVRLLTEWRNRFVRSFLTEFVATEARTQAWLTETVGPDPTRILFMLDDARGQTVGYLGLAFIDWEQRTGELDAIVRGAELSHVLMARAVTTLLRWGYTELALEALNGRARSDNPALGFFRKLAKEVKRVPLRRTEKPGIVCWIEDETLSASSASLVYLTFNRDFSH